MTVMQRSSLAVGLGVVMAFSPCPTFSEAGEYYSWIDASGNMVLTDDPGQIPEPGSRSAVAVHRYQGVPPADPAGLDPLGGSEAQPEPERRDPLEGTPPTTEQIVAEGSAADILLDTPESQLRAQYNWVPLVAPIYVGAAPVYGFWCHRRVQSPVEAFTGFLRRHRELVPVMTLPGTGLNWRVRTPRYRGRSEFPEASQPDSSDFRSRGTGRLAVESPQRGRISSRSAPCCPEPPRAQGNRHRVPRR